MNKRIASWIGLVTALAMVTLGCTLQGVSQSQPPLSIKQFDVSLPSEGAGGGTLAVRLFAPASSASTYFAEGAPVVIEIPGGDSTGSLRSFPTSALSGFVYVTFLFPGGRFEGRTSDGVYDHRGLDSLKAVRDVILFASGAKSDDRGRLITQIVGVRVLTQNVGLLAISNGGNVAFVSAALYGEKLPNLKYTVAWEVPSNGQMVATDAGPGANFDCPPGRGGQRPRFANPYYRAYGPLVLDIDYSRIAYDASADKLFLDGNGNRKWDTIIDFQGCNVPDLNRNGQIDPGEDFGLSAIYAARPNEKGHYSLQTIQAVRDAGLFTSWPAWLDTPEDSQNFWRLQDAALNFDSLAQKRPDLKLMVLASVEDHVQTVQGKPHIRQIFESARRGGLWVTINPSRASVLAVEPSLKTRSDLPENSANTPPADWDNYAYAYPEDVRDAIYHAAGVREMAERTRSSTASPAQVVVDRAVRYQTIDGFGAGLTATGRGGVSLLCPCERLVSLLRSSLVQPMASSLCSALQDKPFPFEGFDEFPNGCIAQ